MDTASSSDDHRSRGIRNLRARTNYDERAKRKQQNCDNRTPKVSDGNSRRFKEHWMQGCGVSFISHRFKM